LSGVVKADATVMEKDGPPEPFQAWWARLQATERSAPSGGSAPHDRPDREPRKLRGFTDQAREDLATLAPHLLLPVEEIRTFRWVKNRKALAVAAIGLLPLVFLDMFSDNLRSIFWAMALYFSALWAVFFYHVFPVKSPSISIVCLGFFGTGLISIAILLQLYKVWPLNEMIGWTDPGSYGVITRLAGNIFAVGMPEELCKALVLFLIVRQFAPMAPQAMLFYGLMAGLGFGIYEGVNYQAGRNFYFARNNPAEYYLLNLIRLTTLPFLHAIGTGIAGYFIGFAAQYPARKRGLLIIAVGLPALLHGIYNTFSGNLVGLTAALVSVIGLNIYLAKSVEFESALSRSHASEKETPVAT